MVYPSRLFLIGLRGCGKSTVARSLAERLGYDWIDSDEQIEQLAGKSIADIFAEDGEQEFRDLETRLVADLARAEQTVVALGGGSVVREENRNCVVGSGPVIWLTAQVETLHNRLRMDATTRQRRPPLTNFNERQELESILAERQPIYAQCATMQVDTEGKSPSEIAAEIQARLAVDE